MKKRGQALVEFVIILPIFIILVFGVIDIGKILYTKIVLESEMSEIITLYESGENQDTIISKLDLKEEKKDLIVQENGEYIDFEIIKEVDIITPGLNYIFDNPYELSIKRSILNE